MNPQQTADQIKGKANGKWSDAKQAMRTGEKQAEQTGDSLMAQGQELLETAQSSVSEFVANAPDYAKSYSRKATKWVKANPVPAAIGLGAIALLLAASVFGRSKKA